MTFQQISQRGKEYLKTAETLFRATQTMTDRAIPRRLKALADDFQWRAEKTVPWYRSGYAKAVSAILFVQWTCGRGSARLSGVRDLAR
jgi:hypothetical protein